MTQMPKGIFFIGFHSGILFLIQNQKEPGPRGCSWLMANG